MSDNAAVLFANDAFYVAFLNHDMKAMDDLWACGAMVSCIHPGWNHLTGREAVIESWARILANHNGPTFKVSGASVSIYKDTAVVICYEVFDDQTVVATNIFLREQNEWRIIHHQAGFSPPPNSDVIEQRATIQ